MGKKIKTFKLIISILVCQGAGVIGSVFTASAIPTWYALLPKPSFNPPNWIFAPVWILLFLLMGIALYLIWDKESNYKKAKAAIFIFVAQLALNIFWSVLFFGLRIPGAAFVEIIFLWFAIIATIIAFARISKPAALLLIPYILWVSFAGYLNYSIWQLSLNSSGAVSCTQDAKLCPDGSYVGRMPPNCDFADCAAKENSGIKGTVLLGPLCPVVRNPPDPECADKLYATTLVLTTSDQAGVIKEFKSDVDGRFSVAVPPGDYGVRSAAAANVLPYCSSQGIIKVDQGLYAETIIYCDTGIR